MSSSFHLNLQLSDGLQHSLIYFLGMSKQYHKMACWLIQTGCLSHCLIQWCLTVQEFRVSLTLLLILNGCFPKGHCRLSPVWNASTCLELQCEPEDASEPGEWNIHGNGVIICLCITISKFLFRYVGEKSVELNDSHVCIELKASNVSMPQWIINH